MLLFNSIILFMMDVFLLLLFFQSAKYIRNFVLFDPEAYKKVELNFNVIGPQ